MNSYLITAKIPKNVGSYFQKFKTIILHSCLRNRVECVVQYVSGRIIVLSEVNPCDDVLKIKGVISCHPVQIFNSDEYDTLLETVVNILTKKNCRNFAIRSNKKDLEIKMGAHIASSIGIPVDLENPDCEITVEKRGSFYFLLA